MRIKLLDQRNPRKLVKAHGNTELAKEPRKPKESKWAKDAQEKNKRDTGAYK